MATIFHLPLQDSQWLYCHKYLPCCVDVVGSSKMKSNMAARDTLVFAPVCFRIVLLPCRQDLCFPLVFSAFESSVALL
jgi:hypothetical protein